MNKGYTTLLAATILAMCTTSFAMAPTVSSLPDVLVGDAEDNIGATDNNWFVFTNAFKFDEFVNDSDSTVSEMKWSFDELGASTEAWYNVNNKPALHVGNTAVAVDGTSDTPHLNPAVGNELRAGNEYASFRDIVFSPQPGTGPFPNPTADHSAGKVVRWFVSDGFNVVRTENIVKTVDNATDFASPVGTIVWKNDSFNTSNISPAPGSELGWDRLGSTTAAQPSYPSGLVAYDYDSVNGAYRGRVFTSYPATDPLYRFRTAGWVSNRAEWMPYSVVGTGNNVRTKYWIYAQEGGVSFSNLKVIPNFRVGVASRFALTQQLEVNHHNMQDPGNDVLAQEVRPSVNPAAPSIYRVDLVPVPVPQLTNNPATEGFLRRFDAFAIEPQEAGYIGMTQSVIGYYPKTAAVYTVLQAYDTIAELQPYAAGDQSAYNLEFPTGYVQGQSPTVVTTGNLGTNTQTASAITLDTANVPATSSNGFPVVGIVIRNMNPDSNTNNNTIHPRVEPGKQYQARFHLTSTQATNLQPYIALRMRSLKFAWTAKLEIGGAAATNGVENTALAVQTQVGTGSSNPSGYYNVTMHTPMSPEIQASQTLLYSKAGPGSATASERDIRVGIDILDTLDSGNPTLWPLQKGNVSCNEILVGSSPLVAD